MSNVLPFETSDLPPEDEDEIDPFAELEIGTKTSYKAGNDALSVFEDGDDPLAAFSDDDPLSSLTEDDENVVEETVISFIDNDVLFITIIGKIIVPFLSLNVPLSFIDFHLSSLP